MTGYFVDVRRPAIAHGKPLGVPEGSRTHPPPGGSASSIAGVAVAHNYPASIAIVRRLSTNRIHTVSKNSPRLVAISRPRAFN